MSNPVIKTIFEKNAVLLTEAGYQSHEEFKTIGEINTAITNAVAAQSSDNEEDFSDDTNNYSEPTVTNTSGSDRKTGHFDGLTVERTTWTDRMKRQQTRVQCTEYRSAWANVELVIGDGANKEKIQVGAINLQTLVDPINEGDRYAKVRAGIINAIKQGLEPVLSFEVSLNIVENFLEDSEEMSNSTNDLLTKLFAVKENKNMFSEE